MQIPVNLGDRSYTIHIGNEVLHLLPELIRESGVQGSIGIVTDAHVAPLYADQVTSLLREAGFVCVLHVMPAGEEQKRLTRIEEICGAMLEAGLDRAGMLIALGGGVVGDITGFAAGVFMRGIPFIQIPTTIVAQVDSSVGGKTGVNHPYGKNTIGVFHQPCAVLIDMCFLDTLPERELRAGMAEVIKHGVIADAALFSFVETHVDRILNREPDIMSYPVARSCEIKAAIVAEDEKEHGVRANLNYGHTFGHAIEAVTAYKTFLHGEAIALGMCAAGELSRILGMVDDAFVVAQRKCISAYGLPVSWAELPVEATWNAMMKDKKARAGTLKFILAAEMGQVVHRTDIQREQVCSALESIRSSN